MLTKLTKKQEALIPKIRDEWVNFALFEGDDIDREAVYKGIDFIYELSDLKKPIKIIVDSPLAVQYAIVHAKALLGKQVRSQVDSQVAAQVDSQVDSQVRSQVRSFTYETLGGRAGWTAYLEYFREIGLFKYEKWDELVRYTKSGQFMGVYLNGLAVVCRRPMAVRRDDTLRLHNDQKPAIEWRDGYKLYFLHGQPFEEKLWKRITSQKMTLKEVMEMRNADERTMAFSMLRPDRLLKGVSAELVHTGIKGTKLYKVEHFASKVMGELENELEDSTEYCMIMDDASTDRQFLEWVDPKIGSQNDADFAQASAWGVPLEDYLLMEQEA